MKLYSISGDKIADVVLSKHIKLPRNVIAWVGSSRLRILPFFHAASIRLMGFRLLQVGNTKRALVTEFGRSLKLIVQCMVARTSSKLTAKINAKIRKKAERFEIPPRIFALLAGLTETEEGENGPVVGQASRPIYCMLLRYVGKLRLFRCLANENGRA